MTTKHPALVLSAALCGALAACAAGEVDDLARDVEFLEKYAPPQYEPVPGDFTTNNCLLAQAARKTAPEKYPDEIYLDYVLPYTVIREERDDWRAEFRERFAPLVAGCTNGYEAAAILDRKIWDMVNVHYNTKRDQARQSPRHSMRIHMASCTGISIILIDACRAVGVPARLVGCNWTTIPGNHSWVEVWSNGGWHVLASGEKEREDSVWFLNYAVKANAARDDKKIYASRWSPSPKGTFFWQTWQYPQMFSDVPADDVTADYLPGGRAAPERFSAKRYGKEAMLSPEPPRRDAEQQDIKEWFLDNYYGRAPVGRPKDMEFKGNEIWIGCGRVKIRLTVSLPAGASKEKPCPVLLVADRRSCFPTPIPPEKEAKTAAVQREFARMANERGYALVTYNVNDVAPDCWLYDRYIKMKPEELPKDAWGVFGLYGGEPDGRKDDTWGTLRAWAWGHSRVLDWIEKQEAMDAKRVAVCGHSRLGKAAVVAGVTDERFKMAYANNAGVGGVHPHRLWKPGVCPLAYVNKHHRHWLCRNTRKFEHDERSIQHDLDEWISLMAPRYLYIASASDDAWAGPEGERFAAEMASRAWERRNVKGWGWQGHVGYHVRKGPHDFTPYDFGKFLDFCKDRL